MCKVVLVYPYFLGNRKSEFRFPALGLGYLASQLRLNGIEVEIVDCTFLDGIEEGVKRVKEKNPTLIGIYSMYTMRDNALSLGKKLREHCDLLVAGGPLPTTEPELFLDVFDVVVKGEGEHTLLELAKGEKPHYNIQGLAFKEKDGRLSRLSSDLIETEPRELIQDLDTIQFPARDLFDNQSYLDYYRNLKLKPATSILSARGCVFECDFCSQPLFGNSFRERSPANIVDEIEQVLELGYEKVVFQDDCFTLTKDRVINLCKLIIQRNISFEWDCLSRVDSLDLETISFMKEAGCKRVFFGLESGSDKILKIMNKKTDKTMAVTTVNSIKTAGIEVGAFFIIGYPGETNETLLETINFSSSLNLDYLSFNFPIPIPGTGLYEKVKDELIETKNYEHNNMLVFKTNISERKLKFAEFKALTQHKINKALGRFSFIILLPYRVITDILLRLMN
jgi:anaerobic magnesium-protoporphyrin IX monomethyl ester cyclase